MILRFASFMLLSLFGLANAEEAIPAQPSAIMNMVPFAVVVIIFYFFMIRPQQKKYKETAAMLAAIKVGDKVSTTSGIIGVISSIDESKGVVTLKANDSVELLMYKSNIIKTITDEKLVSVEKIKK